MNPALRSRFAGLHKALMGGHEGGRHASSASKGRDREAFVSKFLQHTLPPIYRIGNGDIIDAFTGITGQLEIVIEFPFFPSVGCQHSDGSRIYLCEGVAAVIEVKSNIRVQWGEFDETFKKVNALQPRPGGVQCGTNLGLFERVAPVFGVGFTGWATAASVRKRVGHGKAAGLLIIDKGIFCAHEIFNRKKSIVDVENDPERALWMFACCVFECARAYRSVDALPSMYADDRLPPDA